MGAKVVKVAVLGAGGWMGKVHTMAYQSFPHFFGNEGATAQVVALVAHNPHHDDELICRAPGAAIHRDWRSVVNNPDIDLIDICLPDDLHYEVAKAALLAGKHVYCEKPLANTADEARELADLARAKGVITRVGHGFVRNPVHDLAKEIIESGEIGEITMFRGCQHIDVFGDPSAPFMWRADAKLAPTGIVGDTGSHVFSFMDFLVGRVSALVADNWIVTPRRPRSDGSWAKVSNPDAGTMLCRFENGAHGVVDFSRVASGRKFMQTYEVYGTRGAIAYNYDEINRLRFYSNDERAGRRGFRAIDVSPEQPSFRAFLPLPNLGLGYNESKIIEAAEVIRSIVSSTPMWPTFETGYHLCQIVDGCMASSRLGRWVEIAAR